MASAAAFRWLLGPAAPVAGGLGSGPASRVLTGIVQVACVAAAALAVAATLWHRRFRLLLGLAVGAVLAAGVSGRDLGPARRPASGLRSADNLARGSWLASAAFPGPPLFAGAAAVIVAASPWLSRPWRRTAWLTLLLVVVARLVTGTALPMELLLAFVAGADRGRRGPGGVRRARPADGTWRDRRGAADRGPAGRIGPAG